LKVSVTHVDHAPVPWNAMFCTVVPLTDRSIGRTVVVPLANRISTLYEPAAPALFTAHEMPLPTALSPLTNPAPVKPAWLDSTTPSVMVQSSAW
jgi:hypothetical protein